MYRPVLRIVYNRTRIHTANYSSSQLAGRACSQLAGRAFLPGAEAKTFPKFVLDALYDFPFVFKARSVRRNDLAKFGQNFRPLLDQHLKQYNAVLIRGAEINNVEAFSEFFQSLNYNPVRNVSGLGDPRPQVAKDICVQRSDPPALNIEPHHEMSYMNSFPHLFFVHCETPVESTERGGNIILVDVNDIQRQLDPAVYSKFRELGVQYYRQLPDHPCGDIPSWRKAMGTMSRDVAESHLREHGYDRIVWDSDGALHFWITLPAVRPHFATGEEMWFNQAHSQHWTYLKNHPSFVSLGLPESKFPSNTFYGDGTAIEDDVVQHIREVTWGNAYGLRLHRGDVLITDNMCVQHGRLAYSGPRKVSIALAKYY